MNYFELFGLAPDYAVDTHSLAVTYRELQKQFHPDRFATAAKGERLVALQKASEINDAYQTLKSPLRRAEYLLSLAGIELKAEQQTLRDPGFLMQQMEWREQLEDIAQSNQTEADIAEFEQALKCSQQQLQTELEAQLTAQTYEAAAVSVRKLKFMFKLQDELERLEESLLE
ncbi:co-chaperone HscB [Motilimonas sp. 1_MG-2023]|uniref:co-chaperone HscB n=1 Tax=Motilimonas TaxID=1914248 RepID=UPI001E3BBAF2|nr:co-chaperone HscB [Motilimonas sp. 1_MG-2023]MCE0558105.1 co-chaperone HscB [Motilimonas sp. E26]MDO6524464.1 co-chaperone HscB [Motilimonas sp. 1_MG-2023]